MNPEQQAWRALQAHATRQLRTGFADHVVRVAQGPTPGTWRRFLAQGAALLRPGFAERVLRAARNLPRMPSLLDQLAFSAGTVVLCAVAALYVHTRSMEVESERNLASWQEIAMHVEDGDPGP
ncbi:MAG: hypothetical protein WD941_05275 [Opitutus sp.]